MYMKKMGLPHSVDISRNTEICWYGSRDRDARHVSIILTVNTADQSFSAKNLSPSSISACEADNDSIDII